MLLILSLLLVHTAQAQSCNCADTCAIRTDNVMIPTHSATCLVDAGCAEGTALPNGSSWRFCGLSADTERAACACSDSFSGPADVSERGACSTHGFGNDECSSAASSGWRAGAAWRECDPILEQPPAQAHDGGNNGNADDPCRCVSQSDPVANGILLQQRLGCNSHATGTLPFCYVKGSAQECPTAVASAWIQGIAWRNCNPAIDNGGSISVLPFCYVQGTQCAAASASGWRQGTFWRNCDPAVDNNGGNNGGGNNGGGNNGGGNNGGGSNGGNCDTRYRRQWRRLSSQQQIEVVDTIRDFRQRGDWARFQRIHASLNNALQAHGTSLFLPWHRWFVHEFESSVRNLDSRYACFSMPYWDWTLDAGSEQFSPLFASSAFGGNSFGACSTASWAASRCVTRNFNNGVRFASAGEVANVITQQTQWLTFAPRVELQHNLPHEFIGGDMSTFESANDVLFFLHHSMVDMLFALWQVCHSYDGLEPSQLTQTHFAASFNGGTDDRIDRAMPFASTGGEAGLLEVTPRDMWRNDRDPLRVVYEGGDLLRHATIQRICGTRVASSPFFDVASLGGQVSRGEAPEIAFSLRSVATFETAAAATSSSAEMGTVAAILARIDCNVLGSEALMSLSEHRAALMHMTKEEMDAMLTEHCRKDSTEMQSIMRRTIDLVE
ncbi:MAG: hypothetical protein MHM6MM_002428 [Cercozoa sp. M6MM]